MHPHVTRAVDHYLAVADRLLPGRVTGFYVVGSTALGAFRPGRSDIDFVAVIDGAFTERDLRSLRLVWLTSGLRTVARNVPRGRLMLPETVNGVFVAADDITRPVTEIRPLASHTGHVFEHHGAFDVNPVVWKVLAEHGVPFRGPAPAALGLNPEPARLKAWNHDNLHRYWRPWGERLLRRRPSPLPGGRMRARWLTAWGVLGPPRLHHTIATGEVVSKEAAGEYALDVFPAHRHPLIREALACRLGHPSAPAFTDRAERFRQTAEFVLEVVADADRHYRAGEPEPSRP